MFILARALVYATLFIGFFLVFLPARLIARMGIGAPERIGALQLTGIALTTAGAVLALSCVLAFALVGRGTPAPFDPPRRLVVSGPYRFVRNPMYVGAGSAVLGAALYLESAALAVFVLVFWLVAHVFVRVYEEPTLQRTFGTDYEAYCRRVGRWWPHARASEL